MGRRFSAPGIAVFTIAVVVSLAGCGDDPVVGGTAEPAAEAPRGSELEHIHGLGVNPGDRSLYIATHYGLFRATDGSTDVEPVGESRQDVMGFTVVNGDHFLGSGHPSAEQPDLPPLLGLIESSDAGESWESVSLSGEADFHVLRSAGDRVYGWNSATGTLMVSADAGRTWEERNPPGPLVDLAIDPEDAGRVIVSTDDGLFGSDSAGETFRPLASSDPTPGYLAWPKKDALYRIDAQGAVSVSRDAGRRWRETGNLGGQPVAFVAEAEALYAALPDGTVKQSVDGAGTWTVRARH